MGILDPFWEKELIQNPVEVIFSLKTFTKRIFRSKFQILAKWWWHHLVAKQFQKNLTCGQLRNAPRYKKYFQLVRAFFFWVSDIFKPTVNRDRKLVHSAKETDVTQMVHTHISNCLQIEGQILKTSMTFKLRPLFALED